MTVLELECVGGPLDGERVTAVEPGFRVALAPPRPQVTGDFDEIPHSKVLVREAAYTRGLFVKFYPHAHASDGGRSPLWVETDCWLWEGER